MNAMRNETYSTDIDALLAHTEWVRTLARSLVKQDGHGVDDVVQETWLAAMKHPPRKGANPRAWLATVVRNIVRQDRRGKARRTRRERAEARQESLSDTTEVVERADMHRLLVNTLMDLEEPFRTAILLRYFENLPPREVAKRMGCPVETVRAWHRRGLEKLRGRLDRTYGEDRKAWVLALVPLLKGAQTTAGAPALVKGVLLMSTKAKVIAAGAALVVLCTVSILVLTALEPDEPGPGEPGAPRALAQASTRSPPGKEYPARKGEATRSHTPADDKAGQQESSPATGLLQPSRKEGEPRPGFRPRTSGTGGRQKTTSTTTGAIPHSSVAAKLAKLIHDWESSTLKSIKAAAKAWEAIHAYLEELGQKNIHPLKMPRLWWQVFTHPNYRKFKGRPGVHTSKTMEYSRMGRNLTVNYFLQVPKAYKARSSFPLVLCLHPGTGPVKFNTYGRLLYRPGKLHRRAILLAPELQPGPGISWSSRKYLYASLGTLGQLACEYNLDFNRIFLDGHLDSAAESWRIAGMIADTFAGVIIRGAPPPPGTRLADFQNTPFFLVGIPGSPLDARAAKKLARRMRKAGVKVTVTKQHNTKLAAFFRIPRNPYPEKIDWSVKKNHTRRAFYLKSTGEIENTSRTARPPNFRSHLDRKANRLIIRSHRIQGFHISLNDEILDLDREVSIVINNRQVFQGRPERALESLLEGFYQSGDWTRAYPWTVRINVPD